MCLETNEYLLSFESVSCIGLTLCGSAGDAGSVSWLLDPRRSQKATIISVIHSIDIVVAISAAVAVAVWLCSCPIIV